MILKIGQIYKNKVTDDIICIKEIKKNGTVIYYPLSHPDIIKICWGEWANLNFRKVVIKKDGRV